MKNDVDKLLKKHQQLTQSDFRRVLSHVQRQQEEWFINTLLIEDCETPFKYKRKQKYRDITGQRVNLTYYPDVESVAGMEFDIMRVVRLKIA